MGCNGRCRRAFKLLRQRGFEGVICRSAGGKTTCNGETHDMPGEDTKLADLQKERQHLAEQVAFQAEELSLLRARFAHYELALRGSHVTVYGQDRDLRYT